MASAWTGGTQKKRRPTVGICDAIELSLAFRGPTVQSGWWFIAGLLVLALPVCALEIPVSGRIVDENGAAVPGARISLTPAASPQGNEQYAAQADPTGDFVIRLPAPGEYLVSAEEEGYFQLQNRPVQITEKGQEIHLVLNHVRELFQSVDVSTLPSSIDVEGTDSERVLSGLEVLNVPYTVTRDLRNAMKIMPGVLQDARGELHFDGGSENQVLYTLDGFNISDPLTGNFNTRLSVDAVRSLKYASGRFSPEYGKGSAGALAIQTDQGDDRFRYSATNFIPGLDTKEGIHIGTWAPRFGLSGPFKKGRAWFADNIDGEYSELVVPDLPKGQDRAQSYRFSNLLHNQINLTPRNLFFADFLVNYWDAQKNGLGALDPVSTTIDRRSQSAFFSLKDQMYLGPGTMFEFGFAENRTYAHQIPQGDQLYIITPYGRQGNYFVDSIQHSRRDQFLANLYLPAFHLAGTHQLKTGIDLDRLNYSQDTRRTGYEQIGLSGNLLSKTTFAGSDLASRANAEISSYVVDTWKMKPNLVVEFGIRQDWDELIRRINLSPRLSFSYAPFGWKDTKIAGGYAVVYDATNLELFTRPLDQYSLTTTYNPDNSISSGPSPTFFAIGDSHLRSPHSENWSLSLGRRFPRKYDVSVNLLHRRTVDGFRYVAAPSSYLPGTLNVLTNTRRDVYYSAEFTVHHSMRGEYEWMASYVRSRALSNSVLDLSIDQILQATNNVGPLGWDAPNRFLSWGYLPTLWKTWAVAYLFETRSGFPFSVQRETGEVVGPVNSYRYPAFLALNLHAEWRFYLHGNRFALRGGFNNITNHKNPTVVNNTLESPEFLNFYGSEGRHFVVRLRWLGKRDHVRGD